MHRKKINAKVDHGILPETFRINYSFENEPLISIIIPTKNNKKILNRCIKSIEQNTSYKNWEIIIVDNKSKDTTLNKISKFGSGYPSDKKSVNFVKKLVSAKKPLPSSVRQSWKPVQKILGFS